MEDDDDIQVDTGKKNSIEPTILLKLPFNTTKDQTVVTKAKFEVMKQLNTAVSADIMDALSWIEENSFLKNIGSVNSHLKIITTAGFTNIIDRITKGNEAGLTTAIQKLHLTKEELSTFDLICIPIVGSGHFSYWFWVPTTFHCVHLDSYSAAGHAKFATTLGKFATEVSGGKPVSLIKTVTHVAQQDPASNVCAFAAAFFLKNALAQLHHLVNEVPCLEARQQCLLNKLRELPSAKVLYQKYRTQACEVMQALVIEYDEYVRGNMAS